jgi:TolA-binding protein
MLRVVVALGLMGLFGQALCQTSPATLFDQAMSDYANGNSELAASEYGEFIHAYPDDQNCDRAQFYIAEIHFSQMKYAQAAEEFDALFTGYPLSAKAPDAYFMKGMAFKASGKPAGAIEAWRALLLLYPKSDAANAARAQLRAIGNGSN